MAVDLTLDKPQKEVNTIVQFLADTYARAGKKDAVIAVSGGIDSAVSLTLVSEALGPKHVFPIFLPFQDQSTKDSQAIAALNRIPKKNWMTVQIDPIISGLEKALQDADESQKLDTLRKGNAMARARMMVVYDTAKKYQALVCGTENKSEKYLAYFTRFGDEASDIEPIQHLFKTQIRQLAQFLNLPEQFVSKAPSAGLWTGQTDEAELGFSYQEADQVIASYLQHAAGVEDITQFLAVTISQETDVALPTVEKVLKRIKDTAFKHQVPYLLHD